MSGAAAWEGPGLWRVLPALTALVLGAVVLPAAQAQGCYNAGNLTLNFGSVNAGGTVDVTGQAPFSCQSNGATTKFRVCFYLAEGPGGSADMSGVNPRRMTNYNGGTLHYTLYSDAARTQVLGPEGGGYPVYTTTLTVPNGQGQVMLNLPVYGRASAPAGAAAGSYQAQFTGGTLRYAWSTNGPDPASCTQPNGMTTVTAFSTSATVANSCVVSIGTTALDFGSTAPLPAGAVDASSTITLSCPPNVSWQLGLDNGQNALGTQRRMAGPGGDHVAYELYRDSARTQRWGNTLGVDTYPKPTAQTNPLSLTVHGRVQAGQTDVTPGNYQDTLTVTLTY